MNMNIETKLKSYRTNAADWERIISEAHDLELLARAEKTAHQALEIFVLQGLPEAEAHAWQVRFNDAGTKRAALLHEVIDARNAIRAD
jgi:hypothetical protein